MIEPGAMRGFRAVGGGALRNVEGRRRLLMLARRRTCSCTGSAAWASTFSSHPGNTFKANQQIVQAVQGWPVRSLELDLFPADGISLALFVAGVVDRDAARMASAAALKKWR